MFFALFSVSLLSVVVFLFLTEKGNRLKDELAFIFAFIRSRTSRPNLPQLPTVNVPEDDLICKQSFASQQSAILQTKWDYIVIGSGIGGLTVARLLSAYGNKVLVLEQHDITGGCTHAFLEHGWEFDTGIHYVGGMGENTNSRTIMNFLTANQLDWKDLDSVYDRACFPDRTYNFERPKEKLVQNLKEAFPSDEDQRSIDKYFERVHQTERSLVGFAPILVLPPMISVVVKKTFGFLSNYFSFIKETSYMRWSSDAAKTVDQVLDQITTNPRLRAVLVHPFGDYGLPPSRGSWGVHALVVAHYFNGGSYPVKGSQHISKVMIALIEQAAGKVVVKAEVGKILLVGKRAVGVELSKGSQRIYCNSGVISTAGVRKTFLQMLPKLDLFLNHYNYQQLEQPENTGPVVQVNDQWFGSEFDVLKKALRRDKGFGPSCGHIYLYIGLKGSSEELQLPRTNFWCYNGYDHEKMFNEYYADMSKPFPCFFLSFPSAKDPTYSERHPNKSTCIILTEGNYDWFAKWKNGRVKHRGEDYQQIKEELSQRFLAEFYQRFPHLKDKVAYYELSTPITNNYYLGSLHGESYGSIEHSPERVSQMISSFTPIDNLYLSGSDTMTCGYAGALNAGIVTAMCILKREVMRDMKKVMRGQK